MNIERNDFPVPITVTIGFINVYNPQTSNEITKFQIQCKDKCDSDFLVNGFWSVNKNDGSSTLTLDASGQKEMMFNGKISLDCFSTGCTNCKNIIFNGYNRTLTMTKL
jgi:hypothetical protein